ncbi:MAG: ComEA family DNA-binding protein [Desulfuromonadaceae bacterium]
MKVFAKTVLVAVSLLLSATLGFAAVVSAPATDLKGAAQSAKEGVKADTKASAAAVKQDVKGKGAAAKGAAKAKLVDINTAKETDLKAVPGIGDSYAAKIIAGRPYANKAQLKSRKILPTNVYEEVKDLIVAKIPKK